MGIDEGANHVLFKDRQHASLLLADKLAKHQGTPLHVLGLARGGVVTASVVAAKLGFVLDVLVVKKLASPHNAELAIGAVIQENVSLIHWKAAQRVGADEAYIQKEVERLNHEIDRQVRAYRKGKKPISLEGKAVLLIDDGAATGTTMEAAVRWAKKKKAKKIIVAVPIISTEAGKLLRPEVDELVVCHEAGTLTAVSSYYESFPQVTDKEVIELLH
ncbi:MAG: phosphoribosyltransferase family protein [Patescibacteria group bacterium]